MPLRNARQDISTWSKFKPSIAIMKEKSTKISHSVTTGSNLNHKECLKLQNKSYISIQKLYSKTEKNILEDKNYIPRQKLYSKTKVIIQDKRIRASSKVVGIPLTQCWRFPRFAFSGISPNILSPVAKDHEFTILVVEPAWLWESFPEVGNRKGAESGLPYWWNEKRRSHKI